jgi:hypothetical protein
LPPTENANLHAALQVDPARVVAFGHAHHAARLVIGVMIPPAQNRMARQVHRRRFASERDAAALNVDLRDLQQRRHVAVELDDFVDELDPSLPRTARCDGRVRGFRA